MAAVRTDYDLITFPDIKTYMPYQSVIALMEYGTTYQSQDYYLAREKCPYAVFFYCDGGQGEIVFHGKHIPFSAGGTVILPAGTSHVLVSDPVHPFTAQWTNVGGAAVETLTGTYGVLTPAFFAGVDTRAVIAAYHAALNAGGDAGETVSRAILLLTELIHACTLPQMAGASSTSELAQAIKTCIDNHMRETDLSVSRVADMLGLPMSKVTRVFQRAFGVGPHAYITRQKLNNCKLLLRSTSLPIHTIADRMGFADSSYFYAFFKKNTGLSPGEFRRQAASV